MQFKIENSSAPQTSSLANDKLVSSKKLFVFIVTAFLILGACTTYILSTQLEKIALNSLAESNVKQTGEFIFEIMYSKMQEHTNKDKTVHQSSKLSLIDPNMKVTLHRSPLVEELFGPAPKGEKNSSPDEAIKSALKGNSQFIQDKEQNTIRYIHPIRVQKECIECHENTKIGDINGVIDIVMPANTIQQPIEKIMKYFLIFTLTAMVITFLVFDLIISRVFITPIANFIETINSIASSHKLNQYVRCNAKTKELNTLETTFNNMMWQISTMVGEVKNRNRLLEEYKRAIDSSTIVTKTDKNGIITYVNKQFVEISGYKEDELIGKNHNIVRSPNMPKDVFEQLWSTLLKKQPWQGVIENRRKNGESYFVNAMIMPILDENEEILEFIAIRQDITELKQLQLDELKKSIEKAISINTKDMVSMFVFPAISIDQDDKIEAANDSFKKTFEQYAFNTNRLTDFFIEESGYVSKDDIFDWKDMVMEMQHTTTQKVMINVDSSKKEFHIMLSKHKSDKNYLVFLIPSTFCKVPS